MSSKAFKSDQEVRWCPGCGDYVVLATVQNLLADLGVIKENTVFISGIGCSSRFVYYMDTYGFHTIHGRATAVASGLAMTRPELDLWIITGDGDSLSIGLGHLLHLMRRNIKVKILMLNNQIYGLTKGQFSATSNIGTISSSSPFGSIETPFNAIKLALAAECSFVARSMDPDPKHLAAVLKQAYQHNGTAFIEILQNCNVYNYDIFAKYRDLSYRQENCIYLSQGQALRFGKNLDQYLVFEPNTLQFKIAAESNYLYQADQKNILATLLAELSAPLPIALGVFRQITQPSYHDLLTNRKQQIQAKYPKRTLSNII